MRDAVYKGEIDIQANSRNAYWLGNSGDIFQDYKFRSAYLTIIRVTPSSEAGYHILDANLKIKDIAQPVTFSTMKNDGNIISTIKVDRTKYGN